MTLSTLFARSTVIVPLLLVTLLHPVRSFTVRPKSSNKHLGRAYFSTRVSPLSLRVDDDDETAKTTLPRAKEEGERKPERLFDHNDWVEFRSADRKMNDMEDLMLPFVAAFVVYFFFVAVVI